MTTTTVSGQSFIRTLRHYLEKNKNKLSTNYNNKNNNNSNHTSIPTSLLPFYNHYNKLSASNNGFPYMSLLAVTSSVNTSASLENIPYMPPSSSFSLDIHYLYFLYVHFEELGLNIDSSLLGTLPEDAIVFTDHVLDDDMGKPASILSVGSVSSTMSTLSLGSGWQFWKRQEQLINGGGDGSTTTTLQEDLVAIHQQLSTISALKLHMHVIIQSENGQPRSGKRAIQGYEQPLSQQGDVILSLIPFEQLSFLELDHIHPRLIDGWTHFGSNLISLVVKRAGIEDANEVLHLLKINNHDDHHDGEGNGIEMNKKNKQRQTPQQPQLQKRNRLQMLSLQDNNLTTLEKESLQHIQSLTHLNLSSNLLIDVPSALSTLYNLYSLNLSHNMISFVNGINAILGNIQELNLRGNRLTSIVGLERLWALERLDIRNNRIEDITEINRLLSLPNLEDIWVAGNPFTQTNSNYRIDIFNEFNYHELEIRIDGTGPSFTEKLQIKSSPTHSHNHDTTPLATSPSTTPVPNSENQNNNNNSTNNIPNENSTSPSLSAPSSSSMPPVIARAKSKKTKRIIRLRQDIPMPSMENDEPVSPTSSHVLRYADLQEAVRPSLTRRKSNASKKSSTSSAYRRKKSPLPRSTSPTPPLPLSLSNSSKTQEELSNGENISSHDNDDIVDGDKNDTSSEGQRTRLSAQEAFRRKIELMRSEAGTGWLRVLQEMDPVKDGKLKNIPTME